MAIKSSPDSREGVEDTETSYGKRISEFQMAFLLLWRSQQEGDTVQSATGIRSEAFSHCCSQNQFIYLRLTPEEGPVQIKKDSRHLVRSSVLNFKSESKMFLVLFWVWVQDHIFMVLVLVLKFKSMTTFSLYWFWAWRQSLTPYFQGLGLGSHVQVQDHIFVVLVLLLKFMFSWSWSLSPNLRLYSIVLVLVLERDSKTMFSLS